MEEEREKKDYFYSFLRTVETDLKNHRDSYVFNQEQLEKIKEKYDIEVTMEDGCCIYIRLKKGKKNNVKLKRNRNISERTNPKQEAV